MSGFTLTIGSATLRSWVVPTPSLARRMRSSGEVIFTVIDLFCSDGGGVSGEVGRKMPRRVRMPSSRSIMVESAACILPPAGPKSSPFSLERIIASVAVISGFLISVWNRLM